MSDKYLFLIWYDWLAKILNEYKIDLNLKNAQLHYYENNLYLIGGYKESEYSKFPSSDVYMISLKAFSRTEINNSKTNK